MFVDFDKVFNDKPQPQVKIPDAFISYLSKQLPAGVKYVADNDGNCVITGDGQDFTLGGYAFSLTPEDKKVLGKKFTQDDVMKLFYNKQKPIPLQLQKEGFVLVNGVELPIDKLFLNPHNPIKYESGTFFMTPAPFPKPFLLKVGCAGYERELLVTRTTNDSVNIATFESEKDAPLWISYRVDEETQHLSISMSFNLANAKTISDIVESTRIYNAYLDGQGYLCGKPLETKLCGEETKRFQEASAEFWEKVLKIEERLGVHFIPPDGDVNFDTVCLVEQLYQNLVNLVPIRDTGKPETLDGEWEFIKEEEVKKSIGSRVYFEFDTTMKTELFGVKLTLYGLLGVVDAILVDFRKYKKKHKIVLGDVNEEHPRYTASLYFRSEEEMREYRTTNHNKRFAAFHEAKRARDYLTEKD